MMILSQDALHQHLALITKLQIERSHQFTDWLSTEARLLPGPGIYEIGPKTVGETDWLKYELQQMDWTSGKWFDQIVKDTVRGSKKDTVIISIGLEKLESLVEETDAIDTTIFLTRLVSELRGSIESFAGFFDKFVGNSVVAVFGAPASSHTDILNAFLAAREIQRNLTQKNVKLEDSIISPLKVKIGIEYGTVWAGCLRVPHDASLLDYTVIGRPVTVATNIQGVEEIMAGEKFSEKITKTTLVETGREKVISIGESKVKCYSLHATSKIYDIEDAMKQQVRPAMERLPTTSVGGTDSTINYQLGLKRMESKLKQTNPTQEVQLQFVTLASQLSENLNDKRLLSDSENLRNDHNRIVRELNRLALDLKLGNSFIDLCM